MSIYRSVAFPAIQSSVKLIGSNMVPKKSDITQTNANAAWNWMFYNWDWDGWWRFQIDALVAAGCNCIRVMIPTSLITGVGTTVDATGGAFTKISLATFRARFAQLCKYLKAKGVKFYPCLGGSPSYDGETNAATIVSFFTAIAPAVCDTAYSDIIVAVDLLNETPITDATLVAAVFTGARAAFVANGKSFPLTMSLTQTGSGDFSTQFDDLLASSRYAAVLAVADFLDFHFYVDVFSAGIQFNSRVNALTLPWVVGEYGVPVSDATDVQREKWDKAVFIANRPDCRMFLTWAITDQNTVSSDQWGFITAAGVTRALHLAALNKMNKNFAYSQWSLDMTGADASAISGHPYGVFGQTLYDQTFTNQPNLSRAHTSGTYGVTYYAFHSDTLEGAATPNSVIPGSVMSSRIRFTHSFNSSYQAVVHNALGAVCGGIVFIKPANGIFASTNGLFHINRYPSHTINKYTPITLSGVAQDNSTGGKTLDYTHLWQQDESYDTTGAHVVYTFTITDLTTGQVYDQIRLTVASATSYAVDNIGADGTVYPQAAITDAAIDTTVDPGYASLFPAMDFYYAGVGVQSQCAVYEFTVNTNYFDLQTAVRTSPQVIILPLPID